MNNLDLKSNNTSNKPTVWLIKEGESAPFDPKKHVMRTGMLAELLQQQGFEVSWFMSSFDHGSKTQYPEYPIGTKYTSIKTKKYGKIILLRGPGYTRNSSFRRIWHQHIVAKNFLHATRKLEKPDIIVCAYPTPELCSAARKFCQKNSIKLVVDLRDTWPDTFNAKHILKQILVTPLSYYYRKILLKSLKSADAVVAMGEAVLNWANKYYDFKHAKPHKVINLGYKVNRQVEIPQPIEHFTNKFPLNIVFYGMFGQLHNGQIMVEVAREFFNKREDRIKFIMAGDGPLAGTWQKLAQGLDNIKFTGWLDKEKSETQLGQAHIGVIAIEPKAGREWFGNKFYEYIAQGLAVINDTNSELRTIITCEKIGLNVTPGNTEQLVEAIYFFLNNPLELTNYRRSAYQLFYSRYNCTIIYGQYSKFIASLLN